LYYSDFNEIYTDDYVGTKYGEGERLEVIGWVDRKVGRKYYVSMCSICSKDPELFGDGVFICPKNNIVKGQIPCGCSIRPLWTKGQLEIRLSRKASDQGYKFLSLLEPYTGATTKIQSFCSSHGIWQGMNANAFLSGQRCPGCAIETRVKKLSDHNSYDDEEYIKLFFESGQYHEDTIFKRSSRVSSKGRTDYWEFTCVECSTKCEATGTSLKNGQKGCGCSFYNPKQAYIRMLKDGETPIALKYGISKIASNRWYGECKLEVKDHSVWEFPDRLSCITAERFCDENLQTRVVDRQLMPDGFTETTYINNLDKIIEIYKSFGGIQMEV